MGRRARKKGTSPLRAKKEPSDNESPKVPFALTAVHRRGLALLNEENKEAAFRVEWAIQAVESLYYLADLDAHYFPTIVPRDVLGHSWKTVDISHARWATGTAITAIDQCAATLGRLHCGIAGAQLDLNLKSALHRKELKPLLNPMQWLNTVWADPVYQHILAIRHRLTHRAQARTYVFDPQKPHDLASRDEPLVRTLIRMIDDVTAAAQDYDPHTELDSHLVPVRFVIEECRDMSWHYVSDFVMRCGLGLMQPDAHDEPSELED